MNKNNEGGATEDLIACGLCGIAQPIENFAVKLAASNTEWHEGAMVRDKALCSFCETRLSKVVTTADEIM